MTKDTDERQDGETQGARSRKVPNTRASVPMDLVYTTLPVCRHVYQPRRSPTPVLLGLLWRLPRVGLINDKSISNPSLLSGLVFLVNSPHPGAHPELPH